MSATRLMGLEGDGIASCEVPGLDRITGNSCIRDRRRRVVLDNQDAVAEILLLERENSRGAKASSGDDRRFERRSVEPRQAWVDLS